MSHPVSLTSRWRPWLVVLRLSLLAGYFGLVTFVPASAQQPAVLTPAQKSEVERQAQSFTSQVCTGQETYRTFNLSPQLSRVVVNLIYGQSVKAVRQGGAEVLREERDHSPEQFRLLLRKAQNQQAQSQNRQSFLAFIPADKDHYALLGCQLGAPQ